MISCSDEGENYCYCFYHFTGHIAKLQFLRCWSTLGGLNNSLRKYFAHFLLRDLRVPSILLGDIFYTAWYRKLLLRKKRGELRNCQRLGGKRSKSQSISCFNKLLPNLSDGFNFYNHSCIYAVSYRCRTENTIKHPEDTYTVGLAYLICCILQTLHILKECTGYSLGKLLSL